MHHYDSRTHRNHSIFATRRRSVSLVRMFAVLAIAASLAFPASTPPAAAGTDGVPFGPSKLPTDMFDDIYTGTKVKVYPKTILPTLEAARTSRMRVVLVLAGSQDNYRNPDDTFNLDMWKSQIDRFEGIDFTAYVADGTVISHQLIEEAKARTQWGGVVIHNDVLDEMARYSKQIWPTMSTVLRVEPTKLSKHARGWLTPWPDFEWQYLDAAWAQYSHRKGTAAFYAEEQQTDADKQGLALITGLNVLDGGDGSSGVRSPSGSSDEWTMSADELRAYSPVMMSETDSCAFIMYRYETPDSSLEDFYYFRRSDVRAAMQDLTGVAASIPAASCGSGAGSPPPVDGTPISPDADALVGYSTASGTLSEYVLGFPASGGDAQIIGPMRVDSSGLAGADSVTWSSAGSLVLYVSGTGEFRVLQRSTDGGWSVAQEMFGSTGWSQVIPGDYDGDGDTDLLFYRSRDGLMRFYSIRPSGGFEAMTPAMYGSRGWTNIVAGDYNGDGRDDVYWYRAYDGLMRFYTITPSGRFAPLTDAMNGTRNWSAIVEGRYDGVNSGLVFYRDDGIARFYIVDPVRGFQSISPVLGVSAGFDQVVAGDFDDAGGDDVFWYRPAGSVMTALSGGSLTALSGVAVMPQGMVFTAVPQAP